MKVEIAEKDKKLIEIGLRYYIADLEAEQYQQSKKHKGVSAPVYDILIKDVKRLKAYFE
jgi:hypothetical protein